MIVFSQKNSFGASDPVSDDDKFGSAVALSANGQTALVGALGQNKEQGRVYYFGHDNKQQWRQLSSFVAKDPASSNDDCFGIAAALSANGSMALIGASNANKGKGLVYYFTRTDNSTNWTQQSVFSASNPVSSDNDQFGIAVALSANAKVALVSATHQNLYGKNRGLVYYFTRSDTTWIQQGLLPAPNPAADDDEFGTALALSADGTLALIGAEKSCSQGHRRGIVYMYTRSDNVWSQRSSLGALASTCSDGDAFGVSIALSADGSKAVIGAYEHGFGVGKERGIAYYFTRTGIAWTQQSVFFASDPKSADGDEFGVSIALTAAGDMTLVGAHFQGGHARGRVYTFGIPGYPYCDMMRNSFLWGAWFR